MKIDRETLCSGCRREQKVARKHQTAFYHFLTQGAKEPKQPLGCMRTVLVASLRLAVIGPVACAEVENESWACWNFVGGGGGGVLWDQPVGGGHRLCRTTLGVGQTGACEPKRTTFYVSSVNVSPPCTMYGGFTLAVSIIDSGALHGD